MRYVINIFIFSLVVCAAMAVPAKKGVWKTLPLNGAMVRAQLMGDEHMHYWQTEDGDMLVEEDGKFIAADMAALRANAITRRTSVNAHRQHRIGRRNAVGDFTHYTGQKKGLIILVEFSNMHFQTSNDSLLYTRICNEPGFNEGQFRGSVYDYFKAQSYGQFELTFDVVGPVQMDSIYQYYGTDVGGKGYDARPGLMVATACQAVDPYVDFHDYDWDGDGEVDQVMCIYAGLGQADGGNASTIWPHEWQLHESDWNSTLNLDGCIIDTYAVANERTNSGIDGIGTICHEFSHCLGLPDMYDTNYHNFGMGDWSLMDSGSYNGNGFCPSGYSSFDKYTCGWVTPVELTTNQDIEGMKPLTDAPEVYLVRNDAYEDEYYLIENRQKKGWDAGLPGSGILILYVDYDHAIWEYNLVNTYYNGNEAPCNDHQRCTPFHASNSSGGYWGYSGTAYPYEGNDSLTNTSIPAASLYHPNSDGTKFMNKGILNIRRTDGGTMAFRFRNSAENIYIPERTLFYDNFSNCNGTGGNDGKWTTTIASSNFVPDAPGWTVTKGYGGYKCARFGNGSTAGCATTPPFVMRPFVEEEETPADAVVYGEALLTFKAAGWNKDGTTLRLSVEGEGAWVEPAEVTMESFAWTEYTVRIGGKGELRVTFQPELRFLLDDVSVIKVTTQFPEFISTMTASDGRLSIHNGYYTLDGRFMGCGSQTLPAGLYIYANGNTRRVIIH